MSTNQISTRQGIPYWVKIVALFLLGWIFMYATRNILSASMVSIQQELGLSQTQLGLLNTIFFMTYTFTQIPFGMVGDKWGLKRILIIGFLFFGIFTGLTGIATSFAMLMVMRAMVCSFLRRHSFEMARLWLRSYQQRYGFWHLPGAPGRRFHHE